MKRIYQIIILSAVIIGGGILLGQTDDYAHRLLEKVRGQMDGIEDYEVTALVTVQIPNLRIPRKEVRIFFKKPDKLAIKTSGFAIVPKAGILPDPTALINEKVSIRFLRTVEIENKPYHIIEARPTVKGEIDTLGTFWLNSERWTIDKLMLKMEGTAESIVTFSYTRIEDFWLPETTSVYMQFEKTIPLLSRPTIDNPVGAKRRRSGKQKGESTTGTLKIIFRNYRINQSLSDAIFKE